jgi:hypothetical protein
MTENPNRYMQKLRCTLGAHKLKLFREMPVCGRDSAEFGGYIFNPSTKKIFVCTECGTRHDEIYDFRGDRVS